MKENHKKILVVFITLLIVTLWSKLNNLQELNDELEDKISSYQEALSEANDNIETAKWSTWASYDEMGYALDYLETVHTR